MFSSSFPHSRWVLCFASQIFVDDFQCAPSSACDEFIIINLLLVLSFCTIKFLTTFLKMLLILRLGAADPNVNIFIFPWADLLVGKARHDHLVQFGKRTVRISSM